MSTTTKGRQACALLAAGVFLGLPSTALATSITNGDFSDVTPLFGWERENTTEVGEPTDDFTQLETDGTDERTLNQRLMLPPTASVLTFDFAFSTSITNGPNAPFFPDAFAATLVPDVGDFLDILVVDLNAAVPDPAEGFEGIFGAVPIDVALNEAVTIAGFMPFSGGTSYNGRVSLRLPQVVLDANATLSFDLFDELDGAQSIAAVDNVRITPAAAPVPGTVCLLALGLLVLPRSRSRPRSKREL